MFIVQVIQVTFLLLTFLQPLESFCDSHVNQVVYVFFRCCSTFFNVFKYIEKRFFAMKTFNNVNANISRAPCKNGRFQDNCRKGRGCIRIKYKSLPPSHHHTKSFKTLDRQFYNFQRSFDFFLYHASVLRFSLQQAVSLLEVCTLYNVHSLCN